MKMAPAWWIFSTHGSGLSSASSRCSGATRLAMAIASSMSRTRMKAPRLLSEVRITSWRGMVGSSLSILAWTRSMKAASVQIRIDCASSSCSACENRSIATQSGLPVPSETTRISDGPATMSMPTMPNTRRLAVAT
ncbi:hypothetical protein SDC9_156807 [bioreactor metagenome]|uniref:Uncharacterized protein n=1 Tax=bioreactor metagenome TaxID=1076179 RepID=A0A645F794_9ZZZZ